MDMSIRDYGSRVGRQESKRFGTFSYLPPMPASAIRRQIAYMLAKGWACAVEHVEVGREAGSYWYLWKLPLFGENDADRVMNELLACRNANPGHHIRIVGYDRLRQTQGLSFVVCRGGDPVPS